LPSHYSIRYEPPDPSGDEVLLFDSVRRKVKLKGRSFREFLRSVVPLLDGTRTLAEIKAEAAPLFPPQELADFLGLLAGHNLLDDGGLDGLPGEVRAELEPQLNFFHELGLKPAEAQRKLGAATVAVWGLGGPGPAVALGLAAAGVGRLLCVDGLAVSRTDPPLSPVFTAADVGRGRAEVVREMAAGRSPRVEARAVTEPVPSDADALRVLDGVDFVVCCADAGMSSQFYILNRACLQAGIAWTSCSATGLEGVVGPTVVPHETACYLCYKMRAVACASDPEDEFAHQRQLDRRKQDDSGRRENHPFATGVVADLAGLEAFKFLTGLAEPSAKGGVVVFDFLTLACRRHVVLRKPWCPACAPRGTPPAR
jgi:adenylyltransferase/sulfurtransferase